MSKADEQKPWLQSNYEKLIVCIVFVFVIGSLGYLIGRSSRKLSTLPGPPDVRPGPPRVDGGPYRDAMTAAMDPDQLGPSRRPLTVPETRVACPECKRPIPIEDFRARKPCPWPGCGAVPPPRPPDFDGDKDGMFDEWEEKNGLDPKDKDDAHGDLDDDGFTSLEEFLYDTNPRDANHCPLVAALRVEKILAQPFRLMFTGVVKLPDGTQKFALSRPEMTYFKKLDEEVEGWKLIKYEPKQGKRKVHGIPKTVDTSVLTLQKGDETIPLTRNRRYREYELQLRFYPDEIDYKVKRGSDIEIRRKKYRVVRIDSATKKVIVRRADGKSWEIRTETPPPRPKPPE